MPALIAKQPKETRKQTTMSLSTAVLSDLELYCQFIDSARDWVLNEALKDLFRRDKAFTEWREQNHPRPASDANAVASPTPAPSRLPLETETKIERPRVNRSATPCCVIRRIGGPMLRTIVYNRRVLSWSMACATGIALQRQWPFPGDNDVLQLILIQKPWIFYFFRWTYSIMLFSTPLIGFSSLFALLYIFAARGDAPLTRNPLPPYPAPAQRKKLYLVLGELHHPKRLTPVENPRWLWIPEQGLFTGIAVFGAIGSGKTSCCMVPFAEQILSYRASDPERRASALILEVKGDFLLQGAQAVGHLSPM